MKIIGDVQGKNVIILDDMVDTAGTITKAADLMIENGALSVRAFASHGVLSDPATERIEKSQLTAIYFTDSIPLRKESEKIKVLSVADLIANTIINVNTNKSISSSYLV
jgi:ribose-phosphate pyrophosphokinase